MGPPLSDDLLIIDNKLKVVIINYLFLDDSSEVTKREVAKAFLLQMSALSEGISKLEREIGELKAKQTPPSVVNDLAWVKAMLIVGHVEKALR